ncbi:GntR family transcriptional regulator [Terasakiispira papahanaumokuakeensis]|uniref:GntR family transcriptional regulator n=1 Tax=Terasakiispira papahanaumokuakeensis TaxID=197479 RepID=A0A1E2V9Q4_9GAMM|nr:DoxX family protein [Terasakiispira papahanaumokuakeensis]ODC03721.1 GntR family transcriptional regulator [Terasakiispira papahanaumokuakeensis]
MMNVLNRLNTLCDQPDLGKLILRLGVGGLMLFHGIHKVLHGIGHIQGLLSSHGLPTLIGYGVYVGEVIAPILLIAGVLCRPAALTMVGTMLFAWILADLDSTFALTAVGSWALENIMFFVFGSLAILFAGSGRYSLATNPRWQ